MRDIQDKTDGTGDILTAEAFNANYIDELQRVPESADFTLDVEAGPDTDLHMFTKGIVIYTASSNYYDDTGTTNTFVLDRSGNLEPWPSYKNGMTVLFKAATTNTGACTINIDSLGAKNLTDNAGSVLSPGDITLGNYVTARYDSGNDRFEMVVTPVIGGGGGLTSWEENGTTFRPVSSGYDIGDSTHLVGDIYFDNAVYINAEDTGAALRSILGVDGSDICQVGNTNLATNIQSDGTLTHNTVDMITSLLPAQATHSGEYLQTDGAGTLSWASAAGLSSWQENANDFRPITTKTGGLGDSTHLVEHAYFMDDGFVYFGDSQDASIRYLTAGNSFYLSSTTNMDLDVTTDLSIAIGADFYIDTTGDFFINTNPAHDVFFQFSSTTYWQIANTGAILPGGSNPAANIGSTTAEINNIYHSDTGLAYYGSDQDMSITHNGTNGAIAVTTGNLNITTTGVLNYGGNEVLTTGSTIDADTLATFTASQFLRSDTADSMSAQLTFTVAPLLNNSIYLNCDESPTTGRPVLGMNGSNEFQIGNTNNLTNIRSNGTLTHNTVDLITDLLPAQATHAGEFLQTDGAGTLSWAAAGGGGLTSWEENSDDLRPVVSGTGNLGDATHLIEGAYFDDSAHVYLGASQDLDIYHDGLDGFVNLTTGSFEINVPTAEAIYFSVNAITRWQVDSSGNLTPFAATAYDIGSGTAEVKNIFQGDSCIHYFGNDNDMQLYHSGSAGILTNGTGSLSFITSTASAINFSTQSTVRWIVGATGHLTPNTANLYDIGSSSAEINDIYQGDNGTHYFGDTGDMAISHNGTNGIIDCITGSLRVETASIIMENNYFLYGEVVATTPRQLIGVDSSDILQIGNANIETSINAATTVTLEASDLVLENNKFIRGIETGSTARAMLALDGSDIIRLGNGSNQLDFFSNGTVRYNSTTLASGTIDTTASQTITVVDGFITNIA